MLDTGNLLNFIPKEWAEGEGVIVEGNDKPLALQTLNKVFMYNTVGDKTFTNCWDFVAEGVAPLFMGVNSELVGKNFLYMLTKDTYADYLKDAFDAMPDGAAKGPHCGGSRRDEAGSRSADARRRECAVCAGLYQAVL